jgi:hypothetical protein
MGPFWLLSQHRQKPSITDWILNGVFGGVNRGGLRMFQKRGFLRSLDSIGGKVMLILGETLP